MDTTAALAVIPAVIAAMAGVLKLVLNALDRVESRQEKFLGNHMSAHTKALQDLTNAITHHEAKSELVLLQITTALERATLIDYTEVDGDDG